MTARFAAALLVFACANASVQEDGSFADPRRVTIRGYDDHAMEPFVTRDGRYLLFNNSNADPSRTDLRWAERIDDLTFEYRGALDAANSPDLDGVPTVDRDGNLYFVTTRSYGQNLTTIYRGRFAGGSVSAVAPVQTLAQNTPGRLDFDVEVTADGSALYLAAGLFTGGPVPATADLVIAARGSDGQYRRVATDELAAINTAALEYAVALSDDLRELFFTRIADGEPAIFRSTRGDASAPWNPPLRVAAIGGFVEAPTLAPGGKALYYHARRGGKFVIERVTRSAPARVRAAGR